MSFYSKFSDYYHYIFPYRPKVFRFLQEQLPFDGPVLDVGCGIGHYAAVFAEKGHKAIGIDRDADMIRIARQDYPRADFYVMDMLDIVNLKSNFALIFSTGNVMAHLDMDQLERFIKQVHSKLLTGGRWVFQVLNFDALLQRSSYAFPEITADKDRIVFYRYYPRIDRRGTPFQTELQVKGKIVFKEEVTLYPQPSQVYIDAHQAADLRFLEQYADFSKKAYNREEISANIFIFEKAK
ncbi:class I SAM-dependent methyltransferase [candidate division KSB1 bacterium]|nr:class I SAM-dependent methyltransferase [candidate division KSB1 bacterium]RQW02359.1 MAG: class I SAM-dependent methyltransferase [candidate division KSB1 bacterium]